MLAFKIGYDVTHVYLQFTYDFHIFIFIYIHYHRVSDKLTIDIYSCGLAAQLIEHCTGIARSRVQISFEPDFFFRLLFQLLKLIAHCARESQIFNDFKIIAPLNPYRAANNVRYLKN